VSTVESPSSKRPRLQRARLRLRFRVPAVLTSSLVRRLLLVQLVLALVPLVVLAFFAIDGLHRTRQTVVSQSQSALDDASFTGLRQRDVTLADDVAAFLRQRESDLRVLATLPRTSTAYAAYSSAMSAPIRTVDVNGKEQTFDAPLYREVAYIDGGGQEQAKASDVCANYPFTCAVQPDSNLANVTDPANTLYKSETYFQDTIGLATGKIYVGAPIGAYLPYENAYAGTQNRGGQRYRGLIRFAMPVSDGAGRNGIVVLAVESIQLQEIVAHAAPSNPLPQAEIDPREADLTYMVGPDGWVIAHPRAYNIAGVDANGAPVPSITATDRSDDNDLFRPANLTQMGFIDPSLPQMVQDNASGQATSGKTFAAKPVSAPERAIAEATIPFYDGRYNTPAGFGMVVMSTDWARFHVASAQLGKQIDNQVNQTTTRAQQVGVVAGIVALCFAIFFALTIARPILRLTSVARQIERDEWDSVDLARLEQTRQHDELSRLTRVFASMAKEVHERIAGLRKQVQQLQVVIDESKREKDVQQIVESEFFRDLTGKAREMRAQRQRFNAPPAVPESDRPTGTEG
jgi:hypothetical protein